MLRYFVRKSFNEDLQEVPHPKDFEHLWVYGTELSEAEVEQVVKDYDLDASIVRDIYDKHELPRAEYNHTALYTFVRAPHKLRSGAITSSPFVAILKGSSLITLSANHYVSPIDLLETQQFTMRNSKHVFAQLLSYVVGQYEALIRETEAYITNTGQRLQSHEVSNKDFIKFVTVEGNLNDYRTNLSALQVVLHRLCENRHDTFGAKDLDLISDITLHVNQLQVAVDSQIQRINSIRNAYTTISNNSLNQRMKTLTIFTVLIALPNVFYGMFGMNVGLPFADQPWAYAGIVAFTLFVVLAVYIMMRRLRF